MKSLMRVMVGVAWGLAIILALGGHAKIHAEPTGELRVGLSSFGKEMYEPLRIGTTEQGVVVPMYDSLFRWDRNGKLAPGIVESWKLAPDGLSWFFTVRKGVKFHNGDDLTARDVAYAYERYASDKAINVYLRRTVDRAEVVDKYTVRVYTKNIQLYLPYLSTPDNQGLVPPKDYIEKNGSEYFERNPIGSGPFKFVRHVKGDMAEFEALDKHWRQTPAFKHLKMIPMPEESTRVAALKTGEVDIIDIGLESARELEAAGFRTSTLNVVELSVYFNGVYYSEAASLPIADIRVRQALSLAINRDEIRKDMFYGKAGPPAPPALPGKVSDIDMPYWRKYAAKAFRYDLNEAKRLLKEAGYPSGFEMKLYIAAVGEGVYLPKLAEVIQAYWGKIGVKTQIVPLDRGRWTGWRIKGKDGVPVPELMGQAMVYATLGEPITPMAMSNLFLSTGTKRLLGRNPEFDKLVNGAFGEKDPMKRKKMLDTAVKMVIDSYTCATIATAPFLAALGPRVDLDFPSGASQIGFFLDMAKHRKQ
ncbi:MAG: ABC transporter substrate-binding protein [Deltaproteobacteria bacterium]|nr:ABC transporter substrate-binding protein [Deltaproteobacteria bacterium]